MSKKPAKKAGAKKAGAKKAGGYKKGSKTPIIALYGVWIRGAIARGDVNEMTKVAQTARDQIADSQAALKELNQALRRTRV